MAKKKIKDNVGHGKTEKFERFCLSFIGCFAEIYSGRVKKNKHVIATFQIESFGLGVSSYPDQF